MWTSTHGVQSNRQYSKMASACRSNSKRPSTLERRVREQISSLRDFTESALVETEYIVKEHVAFSKLMVKRLERASQLGGVLQGMPEMIETINRIQKHSKAMSEHVEKISHKLVEFTTTLEEVQRKDKSLKGRILRWISEVFKALCSVFSLGAGVIGFFDPITATGLGLGSAISSAASSIASKMSERG